MPDSEKDCYELTLERLIKECENENAKREHLLKDCSKEDKVYHKQFIRDNIAQIKRYRKQLKDWREDK